MIFIYFAWSAPASAGESLMNEWQKDWRTMHPKLNVPIYKLEPDKHVSWDGSSFMNEWLVGVKETGGYGSLVWIREGAVVGYERNVAKAGIKSLAERTELIFSEG